MLAVSGRKEKVMKSYGLLVHQPDVRVTELVCLPFVKYRMAAPISLLLKGLRDTGSAFQGGLGALVALTFESICRVYWLCAFNLGIHSGKLLLCILILL